MFNLVSAYAPSTELVPHLKINFWEDLKELLHDISQGDKFFPGGDLNGYVRSVVRGFEGVHEGMV